MMLADYINERYDLADFAPLILNEVVEQVLDYWDRDQVKLAHSPYGFISYHLVGDALIIYDVYVKPAVRNQSNALKLYKQVMAEAKNANKRVAITFSESGKNEHLGLDEMRKAGFVPAYKTNSDTVFIKGI